MSETIGRWAPVTSQVGKFTYSEPADWQASCTRRNAPCVVITRAPRGVVNIYADIRPVAPEISPEVKDNLKLLLLALRWRGQLVLNRTSIRLDGVFRAEAEQVAEALFDVLRGTGQPEDLPEWLTLREIPYE